MSGWQVHAVVPIKSFARAKRRLEPLLAPHERAALAEAMARDVLAVASRCAALAEVLVVTCDPHAAALAEAAGAKLLPTAEDDGLPAAVTAAARHLRGKPEAAMLVLPADLPLLRPESLERLIAGLRPGETSVVLAQAAADGGTNALLAAPPEAIPFRFGAGSCRKHMAAAREAGIAPRLLALPDLALDLDRPDDLRSFLAVRSGGATRRLLDRLAAGERLGPPTAGQWPELAAGRPA